MSIWGQRDDPSQLTSGERADHVAAELQAAFGGPASDVQRVCSLLCLLRQQFSEQAPKNWPSDTVKRLWQSIIGALRVAQAPEVQVAACAAVEALGQSCSSCTDLEREPSAVEDAASCVVETLSTASSRQVKAAAIKALLSLSGCLNCRCFYDKHTQDVLGGRGAVQTLLAALPGFLAEVTEHAHQQQQGGERPAEESTSQTVADIFRALHYTCLLNPTNTAELVAGGGYPLVVQGLAAVGKDLNVQEHGAMLLAEMACAPGMAARELLDSIVTVANIARLQLQDKYIEVARAAVWSLGRLASHALTPRPAAAVGSAAEEADEQERDVSLSQSWPLLSDPVLRVVVSMLQSCHLQDDPLVKHCLDYIAVVAAAASLHHPHHTATSNGTAAEAGPTEPNGDVSAADKSVAAAAALDEAGAALTADAGGGAAAAAGPSALLPLLRLATEAVLATARVACDLRLQAVVLRTLHILLLHFPGAEALQLSPRQAEVVEQVMRLGAAARQTLEQQQPQQQLQQQQHHHQHQAHQASQQHIYASKDLFLVNLYSLTVVNKLTDASAFGGAGVSSAYQAHFLACLAGVVRHLSEGGGDSVSFDAAAATGASAVSYLSVGCCRYACHCCFIHDSVRGGDVVAATRAAAQLLAWGGGPDGVNATDRDGCGALHFLAAGGVAPLLSAFIDAAGPNLDFLRRTRAGLNALQLARAKKDASAVEILEVATESAAKAAQDALLKELEEEGAHEGSHKKAGAAAPAGSAGAARQHAHPHKIGAGAGSQEGHLASAQPHGATHGAAGAGSAPGQVPVGGESEEARHAREELEQKRRARMEAYEAALEQRRRQLEEEARQQAAEEARLIELAQAESLRMATPPPQAPSPVDPSPGISAEAEPCFEAEGCGSMAAALAAGVHGAGGPDGSSGPPSAFAAGDVGRAAEALGHFHSLQQPLQHQHQEHHETNLFDGGPKEVGLQSRDLSLLQQQQQELHQQQQQQLERQLSSQSTLSSSGTLGTGAGSVTIGSVPAGLDASLHAAAAAAMASGAPLPPSMAQILAQLAVEQQAQPPLMGVPGPGAMGAIGPMGPRSSLSSMDEQVTMLHGGTGGGANSALAMRRVVSKGSFLPEDGSAGLGRQHSVTSLNGPSGLGGLGGLSYMSAGGGGGASGGGGFGGYAGSFGNLLTAAGQPMGLPGGGMEPPPGLMGGGGAAPAGMGGGFGAAAGGGMHPPGSSGGAAGPLADGSVCSDSLAGSVDGMPLPSGVSGGSAAAAVQMQAGGWPGSAAPAYGNAGPSAFINSTLVNAAAAAAVAAPPPGLQRGGPSSTMLAQQAAMAAAAPPPAPPASHLQSHPQLQPQGSGALQGGGAGGGADSWLGSIPPVRSIPGRSSHADLRLMAGMGPHAGLGSSPDLLQHAVGAAGPPPLTAGDRAMPPLQDALATSGGEMWDVAEELTRGSSRQLWLGNVNAGLPPGHLQAICQQFGLVQDVMVAPGTLSAVVLFARNDDASRAAHALHGRIVPSMSYEDKPLVVRYCGPGGPQQLRLSEAGAAPPQPSAAAAAPTAPVDGGASGDGLLGLGLPSGLEAALSAAGFGPSALEAAMQGLLPPEQQQALHTVLMQASASASAAAAGDAGSVAPQARALQPQQQPQQSMPLRGGAVVVGGGGLGSFGQPRLMHHGSVEHLAGLAGGSVGDFASLSQSATGLAPFGGDQLGGGGVGGAGLYGGPEDAEGLGPGGAGVSGGGARAAGSSTGGGGGSTSGEMDGGACSIGLEGDAAVDVPEGKPSRHLWLGNIPLKPNKLAMELLFARFGPLESVRVFPGKTFAFVNYLAAQHAVAAKMALDGQPAPSVTGSKPMVIRYQKDTSTVPANLGLAAGKSMSRSSSTQNLTGLTAAASLARLLDDDLPPEPAVNLSNKLNPNNIHYDRELAARYKRMSKAEKEALWAQDRAMQALGANAAAAAAAVNASAAGIAGLLDPNAAAAARLLAQAGLGNLAAGLGGGAGSDFLLPRVMSAGALDYLAASSGHGAGAGGAAAAAVGGGGGHGGLFRVNTTQSLLGMQQAANAAMLLPQMGAAAGGLQGLLGQHGAAAAAAAAAAGLDGAAAAQQLQHHLHAAQQQAALQQQLQQQALQQQLQQLAAAGGGGGQALLNNIAVTQALANMGLGGGAAGGAAANAAAAAAGAAALRGTGGPGSGAPAGGTGGLDWSSMQAALANLGLGGASSSGAGTMPGQQNAALAALLQQQQQQQGLHPQAAAAAVAAAAAQQQQRLQQQQQQQQQQHQQQQQQQLSAAAAAAAGLGGSGGLSAAVANAFGGADSGAAGGALAGMHAANKRLGPPGHARMVGVGLNSLAGLDSATAAALVGGLQGLGGAGPVAGVGSGMPPGASAASAAAAAAGMVAVPPPGAPRPPTLGTFKQIPPSFLCPLTRQLMSDPVVAADGITYNRPAIADWLRQHDASPVTRQPLANKMLTPNVALRNAIMAELGFMAGPA